jgi:cytochrome c oxidase subunit 2
MHVDPLEKKWITVSIFLVVFFIAVLGFYAIGANVNPPSNVEPIDSVRLHLTEEFAEDNLGVRKEDDGSVTVTW